jgi:esterase/lipase superfamily enzyme
MRIRHGFVSFIFMCALGIGGSLLHAQTAQTFDSVVKQSLISLISGLASGVGGSAPKQSVPLPAGATDSVLRALGRPRLVSLSSPVTAQGLTNFNAHVIHAEGTSEWLIGALANGQIATYELKSSVIGKTSPSQSSTDKQQTRGIEDPLVAVPPPAVDPRVVEFLFATTRQKIDPHPGNNVAFNGERGPLTYGAASVRIPDDHKIGRIELPSSWRLFGLTLSTAPDDHEHFVIKGVSLLSETGFDQIARAKGANTALIFIHGFNTSFEDALYRNAQIVWDLQYRGLSVLFTWASRGEIKDYIYDRESAELATGAFITLLQKLKRDYGIEQVNVLAHSMGNLLALDALASYSQTANPVQITRLIMAAPDVDRDRFQVLAPAAKAVVGGLTLYASSADRAMEVSRAVAGGIPRAGDVPADGPVVLPAMETIDVTAVGGDIFGLNHNVFAASRDVMEDISAMLRLGLPSPRLMQIRAVPDPPSAQRYWRYVP